MEQTADTRPVWNRRAAFAERSGGSAGADAPDAPVASGTGGSQIGAQVNAGATGAPAATGAARSAPGIGAGQRASARPGAQNAGMGRDEARQIIDHAMGLSVSDSSSDDYVRNNVTAEVLQHATLAEKAHMLQQLMDGPTGADDEAAMARILQSVNTADELESLMTLAGGAERVWDELDSQRETVANDFKSRGMTGAQMLLRISDALPTSSSLSDDFVANHIDAGVLAHATNAQKARMLEHLMEGPTGGRDERAMARILNSVGSAADMQAILQAAGGADRVWSELGSERDTVARHLQGQGQAGAEMLIAISEGLSESSSLSDDFVANYVNDAVLAHATNAQKARMLRHLMDGPTGGRDEQAMARVLGSVRGNADMQAVLRAAGGAERVWSELGGQQGALASHLRGQGAAGAQALLAFSDLMPITSSASDDFVANHVDATVLSHATNAQKSRMLRHLMDGPTGDRDERAMRRILQSAGNNVNDVRAIMTGAGGARAVWAELEGQQAAYAHHLRGQGAAGRQMMRDVAGLFPAASAERRRMIAESLIDVRGTATNADADAVVEQLARMPERVLQQLATANTQVVVVRNSVTETRADLRGVRPRGYPPGRTWDNVPGLYDTARNEVIIATRGGRVPGTGNGHGTANLVFHEAMHAYDHHTGASNSAAFRAARTADRSALSGYERQAGAAGREESFAESAARYWEGNGGRPHLDAYFRSNVDD
ncbi:MAG: hypothetical protein RIT81_37640 [Deltaproteobacteria bacterium]